MAQRIEFARQLRGHVLTSKNIAALQCAAALIAARHMESVTGCLLKKNITERRIRPARGATHCRGGFVNLIFSVQTVGAFCGPSRWRCCKEKKNKKTKKSKVLHEGLIIQLQETSFGPLVLFWCIALWHESVSSSHLQFYFCAVAEICAHSARSNCFVQLRTGCSSRVNSTRKGWLSLCSSFVVLTISKNVISMCFACLWCSQTVCNTKTKCVTVFRNSSRWQ